MDGKEMVMFLYDMETNNVKYTQ